MNTTELETGQAEFKVWPTFQKTPLIVRGDSEVITEMYQEGRAEYETYQAERRAQLANKVATTAVEAVKTPVRVVTDVLGSVASKAVRTAEVSLYDRKHGTRFKAELAERRQLERDLAMARKLGLLSYDSCQKHRHAVSAVKALR